MSDVQVGRVMPVSRNSCTLSAGNGLLGVGDLWLLVDGLTGVCEVIGPLKVVQDAVIWQRGSVLEHLRPVYGVTLHGGYGLGGVLGHSTSMMDSTQVISIARPVKHAPQDRPQVKLPWPA